MHKEKSTASLNFNSIYLILFLVLFAHISVFATDTIYFNNKWEITNKNTASYYRIAAISDDGLSYEGEFHDYILNKDQLISKGSYFPKDQLKEITEYYDNGALRAKGWFKHNTQSEFWEYYYENGQLKMIVDFNGRYFTIKEYYDEEGNASIVDGTGHCELELSLLGIPAKVTAHFKNGFRSGKWIYSDKNNTKLLIERYSRGAFVSHDFFNDLKKERIKRPYLLNYYFDEGKYFLLDNFVCEKDLDIQAPANIRHLTKILNLSNSDNLSFLNSNMPIDAILSIARDKDNNYWFGTQNHGLLKFDSIINFYNRKNTDIKGNYISNIEVDKNNKVWFSYGNNFRDFEIYTAGVACYYEGDIKIYNTKKSELTSNNVQDIVVDKNNIKWFATINCIVSFDDINNTWQRHYKADSNLRHIDTVKFHNKRHYQDLADVVKRSSYLRSYDVDIVSTSSPHFNIDRSRNTVKYTTLFFENPNMYSDITILPDNTLFIDSDQKGCMNYDGNNWESISPDNTIECVKYKIQNLICSEQTKTTASKYVDSDIKRLFNYIPSENLHNESGNIWLLYSNKVVKINGEDITEYLLHDQRIKSSDGFVFNIDFHCLFIDFDGSVWAGINGGLIKLN